MKAYRDPIDIAGGAQDMQQARRSNGMSEQPDESAPLQHMADRDFWIIVYRALIMIARAIATRWVIPSALIDKTREK